MKLKELFTDDDAVSPVIGVILMVAITVILAAVIAGFVLNIGQSTPAATPSASFKFNYEETSSGQGYVKIVHDGGDAIKAETLYTRGSGTTSESSISVSGSASSSNHWLNVNGGDEQWTKDRPKGGSDTSKGFASGSQVSAADHIYVAVNSDYSLKIIWEPSDKETSATLGSDKGPDAS